MGMVNGIKGFFIGVALVVPGLSGSIFAVVVGLYEKILYAINHFGQDWRSSCRFLLPVAVGAAAGILASTKAVLWVCQQYPLQSYLFFIGLIMGSLPLILRKIRGIEFQPLYLIITALCFLALLVITRFNTGDESYVAIPILGSARDAGIMVYAGAFSVSLMLIPGVSGSVMLMVINQYGTVYNAVGSAVDMIPYVIAGEGALAIQALRSMLLIVPFMVGAVAGLLLIARLMGFLLKRYEAQVYYGVGGVIMGAIYTLAREGVLPNISGTQAIGPKIICILCVIGGILCTVFLDQPQKED